MNECSFKKVVKHKNKYDIQTKIRKVTKMKKWIFTLGILVTMCSYSQNQVSTTPNDHYDKLVNTDLSDGYPTEEEKNLYLDELTFQQGVQSYIWALPAVNMWSLKEASEKAMGAGYNIFPVWAGRMRANTLIPTPNADVIYAMSYLDLKQDGPLVVEVPPGIQGLFDDFWQRPIETEHNGKKWYGDVGLAGPDEGKGGNFLLLPPDYKGDIPDGYYVYRSRTYNVFVFWRSFFQDPNNLKPAVDLVKRTKIYPLGKKASAKPMKFPDATNLKLNMLFPEDGTYFETLSRFINAEYVDPEDMYMRGMLASIGIEKGKPFNPDSKTKELLNKAAISANKMSKVVNSARISEEGKIYKDSYAVNIFKGKSPWFQGGETYTDVNFRAAYFTMAFSTSPGMAADMIDKGAKYPSFSKDVDGNYLNGSNTYVFHIPANPPAKIFWSVSLYDPLTGSGLQNGQKFFSINSMDKPEQNADGSWDFYLGPTDPGKKNWIKTIPEKGFLLSFRLYGPMKPYFDQTWKTEDPKKIK